MAKHHYVGAIHIHTKNSDGTGDLESISNAAKKAGLSWIIITDHNYYIQEEGFYNGVCVISGEELSPPESNHYLALGINKHIEYSENSSENVENVRKNGGFGFVAHPDESQSRNNHASPIRWLNKNITGDGVEIWNWFSDWADSYDDTNIFKIAYAYLFREKLINGAPLETLKWWDNQNKQSENIIPAIGGVDAHALKISNYVIPVTIFPYKYCFETTQNILSFDEPLPFDFPSRKQKILDALKNGKNIIFNGKTKFQPIDIDIHIKNTNSVSRCGEKITNDENTHFCINLPKVSDIKILKDGEIIYIGKKKNLELEITETGKYRAEIFYKGKPCIYTNPIQVI